MPMAASAGTNLYYEEAGSGHPVVFVHEFFADGRAWEAQMRAFARDYRCVAFNARGYPPSDVPQDASAYGHEAAADDIAAIMNHIGADRAHVVGLSMGAYAALMFGLRHPAMASALVIAGCGSGAPREQRVVFKAESEALADEFLDRGAEAVAQSLDGAPTRVQLQNKDPRGWQEFARQLAEHSALGSALTLRQYQALRPSLHDFADALGKLTVPVLLAVGDEDEPCLDTNLFLKRTIPTAGLWVVPNTGHAVNLEEPAAFNGMVRDFFGAVERGRWPVRDPRSRGAGLLGGSPIACGGVQS